MKRLWHMLLPLMISACQTDTRLPISSAYFQIPVGSHLVLNQPLEIPPTSATVRLQFGTIVSRFKTQDFEPVCVFESRIVGEVAQRIEPDRFEIIRVRRDDNTSSAQVTPLAGLIKVSSGGDAGGGRRYYKTEMFLRSAKQPQILVMTCQHAREAGATLFELRPLTMEEIRQALGGYFTLQLAGVEG